MEVHCFCYRIDLSFPDITWGQKRCLVETLTAWGLWESVSWLIFRKLALKRAMLIYNFTHWAFWFANELFLKAFVKKLEFQYSDCLWHLYDEWKIQPELRKKRLAVQRIEKLKSTRFFLLLACHFVDCVFVWSCDKNRHKLSNYQESTTSTMIEIEIFHYKMSKKVDFNN